MFSLLPWQKEQEVGGVATTAERPMSLIRSDLDEVFDRLLARWSPLFADGWASKSGVAIEEKDDAVLVRADAPDFEPPDFDIQVSADTMSIVAERKKAKEGKPPTVERRLERRFTLPARVDPAKVEAVDRHGVLEVRLVRGEPIISRKVTVKA